MYLALLTLPCSTFLCLALFGRFLGARGAIVLSICSAISITILAFSIFYEVALCACPCQITLAPYFFSGLMDASWGFLFDTLTSVMITVVTLISCLVVIYSCSYMIEDPHFVRFISYLKLFTVAMLLLVTADNYVQLFVGWEGVGLASFLLISFWFTRLQASKAAIQAMLLNRVGDIGLALGIIGLFFTYKTTNYQALFCINHAVSTESLAEILGLNILDISCILLFIGAMGKSGQFGLHAWLPNAMNAPTPVSALLHAATMVELCHLQTQVCNLYSALSWKRPKNQKFTIREKIFLVRMVVSFQDHPGGIPFQGHFGEVPGANQLETALFSKAGSSETVRRITPPLHNQKCIWLETCNDFLYWFIGFCEGDGSFVVGADGDLHFELTQALQDMDLLQHIQATLGFGSVSARQESAMYSDGRVFNRHVAVFTVTHVQNFLKLIQVFNGHLRVDAKQQQFQNWLLRFNQRYGYNTQYKPGPAFVNFGDAWLSGFSDAEATLTARLRACHTSRYGQSLVVSFTLPQKSPDILYKVRHNFVSKAKLVSYDKSWQGYRLNLGNKRMLQNLIQYFDTYNLKTRKAKEFDLWIQMDQFHMSKLPAFKAAPLVLELDYLKANHNSHVVKKAWQHKKPKPFYKKGVKDPVRP